MSESMNKKSILVGTIFILIAFVIIIYNFVNITAKHVDEESQDILYKDVIITALSPTIDKAVDDYYKNILSESLFYDTST